MNACMTTGSTIATPTDEDEMSLYPRDTIVVLRNGRVIGLLSAEAQEDVKTLRMTFTRSNPKSTFEPLQGQCVETF